MEDPQKRLIDELCSLLEEATILSICNDYDLQTPAGFAAARDVLLAISQDVEAEEATCFNPSGFAGVNFSGNSPSYEDAYAEAIRASEGDLKSNDGLTTTTESSQAQSVFSGSSSKTSEHEGLVNLHLSALDDLSDEEKERQLASMFVSLKLRDVKRALQNAKGDADLAMDELLNLQWLEQEGERPKGIDIFFVSDDDAPKGKGKRKGKKKNKKAVKPAKAAASKSADTTPSEESSRDEAADNNNIDFISKRFGLPVSDIAVQYQRNNYSLGATIVDILDNYINAGVSSDSHPNFVYRVEEQMKRVTWIPILYFAPIFDGAVSNQAAIEIIDALGDHFPKPAYMKYEVPYNIVASDQDIVSEIPLQTSPRSPRSNIPSSPKKLHVYPMRTIPTTLQEASAAKAAIGASLKHSQASASSALRKGPLMRQAAVVYTERWRAEASSYRQAISVEADFLVNKQSTEDMIDLHGVSVQDGVNIALDRVWRWWNDRSDDRSAHNGLKVVTGLGRHNADGRSPLRINVCKALVADGWKLEVLTGAFLVTGRRR